MQTAKVEAPRPVPTDCQNGATHTVFPPPMPLASDCPHVRRIPATSELPSLLGTLTRPAHRPRRTPGPERRRSDLQGPDRKPVPRPARTPPGGRLHAQRAGRLQRRCRALGGSSPHTIGPAPARARAPHPGTTSTGPRELRAPQTDDHRPTGPGRTPTSPPGKADPPRWARHRLRRTATGVRARREDEPAVLALARSDRDRQPRQSRLATVTKTAPMPLPGSHHTNTRAGSADPQGGRRLMSDSPHVNQSVDPGA